MKIAVLTSGGDAPGMNAAIRAISRYAIYKWWDVFGVHRGYQGLLEGDFSRIGLRDVGGIIGAGGTILGSSRSPEFQTPEGREEALKQLRENRFDVLVIIGGNGTQKGSFSLFQMGFPVIGVASTIDNDLYGSDITIGVDTALNVALEAIDRIKVTASSHGRVFAVEVMGRDCGYIALMAGIAGGAEVIIIPEIHFDIQKMVSDIHETYQKGKHHAIIVTAEGATYNAGQLSRYFLNNRELSGFELRNNGFGLCSKGATPQPFRSNSGHSSGVAAVESWSLRKTTGTGWNA